MSGQFLPLTSNLMSAALLALRSLKQCGLVAHLCFFIFFIVTGCSSLHVDTSPTVDWGHVQVIEFQSPLQDTWKLAQLIRSELKNMGFQIEETHNDPDLLFSYFTQESPDLTAESEVVTRLKSLHVQFIDPATNTLVTAVDYFYPEITNQSAPEIGVKEVFSGLRQQIHKEINSPSAVPAMAPTQTVKAVPVVVAPQIQIQESQTEQLKSDSVAISNEPEENAENNAQSKLGETVAPRQEAATTELKKPEKKTHQTVQQTRSPWLPKFKSWGFENWGQDSASDY